MTKDDSFLLNYYYLHFFYILYDNIHVINNRCILNLKIKSIVCTKVACAKDVGSSCLIIDLFLAFLFVLGVLICVIRP